MSSMSNDLLKLGEISLPSFFNNVLRRLYYAPFSQNPTS